MGKKSKILAIVLLLSGLTLLLYPFMGSIISHFEQMKNIAEYNQAMEKVVESDKKIAREKAEQHNKELLENNMKLLEDNKPGTGAYDVLEMQGTRAVGYLKMPKINVSLPIFGDTDHESLLSGVGVLEGSSVPVGGESTHTVLTGHTGIPTASLLNDLDKVNIGDRFYVYVLGEVHGYRVDQINVVLPEDKTNLKIEQGKDLMTLVTCTPYGLNTHRLLVRGVRDDSGEELQVLKNQSDDFWSLLMSNLPLLLSLLALFLAIIIVIIIWIFKMKHKSDRNKKEDILDERVYYDEHKKKKD